MGVPQSNLHPSATSEESFKSLIIRSGRFNVLQIWLRYHVNFSFTHEQQIKPLKKLGLWAKYKYSGISIKRHTKTRFHFASPRHIKSLEIKAMHPKDFMEIGDKKYPVTVFKQLENLSLKYFNGLQGEIQSTSVYRYLKKLCLQHSLKNLLIQTHGKGENDPEPLIPKFYPIPSLRQFKLILNQGDIVSTKRSVVINEFLKSAVRLEKMEIIIESLFSKTSYEKFLWAIIAALVGLKYLKALTIQLKVCEFDRDISMDLGLKISDLEQLEEVNVILNPRESAISSLKFSDIAIPLKLLKELRRFSIAGHPSFLEEPDVEDCLSEIEFLREISMVGIGLDGTGLGKALSQIPHPRIIERLGLDLPCEKDKIAAVFYKTFFVRLENLEHLYLRVRCDGRKKHYKKGSIEYFMSGIKQMTVKSYSVHVDILGEHATEASLSQLTGHLSHEKISKFLKALTFTCTKNDHDISGFDALNKIIRSSHSLERLSLNLKSLNFIQKNSFSRIFAGAKLPNIKSFELTCMIYEMDENEANSHINIIAEFPHIQEFKLTALWNMKRSKDQKADYIKNHNCLLLASINIFPNLKELKMLEYHILHPNLKDKVLLYSFFKAFRYLRYLESLSLSLGISSLEPEDKQILFHNLAYLPCLTVINN